jgi:hypothetical protein
LFAISAAFRLSTASIACLAAFPADRSTDDSKYRKAPTVSLGDNSKVLVGKVISLT